MSRNGSRPPYIYEGVQLIASITYLVLGRIRSRSNIDLVKLSEREIGLIISYNRFWWLTSITNHVD
jgi:hypothetical protein